MEELKSPDHRRFKDELYGEFARIGQALASPKRLEMLDLLAQREWPVDDLAREMNLTVANASQHLQVLLHDRLVEVRRQGTRAYYRLAGGDVYRLWQVMRELGETRLAEVPAVVRRHLGDRPEIQVLNVGELLRRVRAGDIILLDVRPEEEYRAGHLPGARPVPLVELTRTLKTLPKHRQLVVYCRGPYCLFSDEAVALLRRKGFQAHRLRTGYPDWQVLRHSSLAGGGS
jgi:DNA-binding transcriptional ArsR family regulator